MLPACGQRASRARLPRAHEARLPRARRLRPRGKAQASSDGPRAKAQAPRPAGGTLTATAPPTPAPTDTCPCTRDRCGAQFRAGGACLQQHEPHAPALACRWERERAKERQREEVGALWVHALCALFLECCHGAWEAPAQVRGAVAAVTSPRGCVAGPVSPATLSSTSRAHMCTHALMRPPTRATAHVDILRARG